MSEAPGLELPERFSGPPAPQVGSSIPAPESFPRPGKHPGPRRGENSGNCLGPSGPGERTGAAGRGRERELASLGPLPALLAPGTPR